MAGKAALIVGNGERPSPELFAACQAEADLVLCADGGINTAAAYGCKPDYIVGDFDSAAPDQLAGEQVERVDADNTGTDAQKVLRVALRLGVERVVMLGFTGGRTDHTLWNLSLLKTFGDQLDLRLVDDYCEIRLIGKRLRFRADVGQLLSLCPLSGPVEGIVTSGLRFPLRDEALIPGQRDGISNEVVANLVEISVQRGDLLLCVQRQSASGKIEVLS
ncbi:MAG: thiamine diphosphokinase [Candidatus Latescibacteria bacterium]|nr:thiamine diphosphokinase [Candidatus Latescibacterota bacterium]